MRKSEKYFFRFSLGWPSFSELQTDTTYAHLELVQDVSEYEFDALSSHLQSVALGGPALRPHPRSSHHV